MILDDVGSLNAGRPVANASPPPPSAKAARIVFQARVQVARRAAAVAEVATPAALRGAALEHCQALAGEHDMYRGGADPDLDQGANPPGCFDIVAAMHAKDAHHIFTRCVRLRMTPAAAPDALLGAQHG